MIFRRLLILFLGWIFTDPALSQPTDGGVMLKPRPTHIVLAPQRVRAAEVYQIVVGIFNLPYQDLNLHASVRREGDEITSVIEHFTRPAFRTIQLRMPDHLIPGRYTLLVEGLTSTGVGTPLFRNETKLSFSPKRASVFIKTDKIVYFKAATVRYQVIAVKPNLLPMSGSINIYVRNSAGVMVRRWLDVQVNHGIYRGIFPTGNPQKYGWWSIEVEGWGHRYSTRFFTVNFFFLKHDLNVTIQPYVFDNEFAVTGTIMANNSHSGLPMTGNVTIDLKVIPPSTSREPSTIHQEVSLFTGVTTFMFTMEEIRNRTDTLAGTKLEAHVNAYDWYGLEYTPVTAHSLIMPSDIRIRFLGGKYRTFKPGVVMPVYIAVYAPDGTRSLNSFGKIVYIATTVRSRTGSTRTIPDGKYLVPDNGVVKYTIIPQKDDELINVRASYSDKGTSVIDLTAYRHYTESGHYLHITTSSEKPKVNHYMVFTVVTSTHVPIIYYQVIGNGNILVASTLQMHSRQKTFAIAASRDMIPNSKMVVFCLLNDGEILADSLSLFVSGEALNKIEVRVNKGKDFTGDTVEITALTGPSTLTAFTACPYHLYSIGAHTFLSRHEVDEDLLTYDENSNSSFKHTWSTDNFQHQNVHFNAPSYAIDANTTFLFAGLIALTDAGLTRIPGYLICNETLGYRPCFDGSCYTVDQQCDRVKQCEDGADEMGCPDVQERVPFRPDVFSKLYMMWAHMDGNSWAWKNLYTKPNGRVDFQVQAPIRPADWLISAVSMNKDTGLAVVDTPPVVDTRRAFYMIIELPKAARRGEQLGIQVSLFNYWNQPIEALITLKESSKYRSVKVNHFGYSSSYNPRTVSGDMQTMIYMIPGEVRQRHFPVLPVVQGKVPITIIAASTIRTQKQTVSVSVSMDGVTNPYHTPYLIDLINKGSVMIPDLLIAVPERFIKPGQREHLYVPGSADATVSVVGDFVGAGFLENYLDAYNLVSMVFGSGEQHIFNFGINAYWLKFLKATNQLKESTLNRVLTQLTREVDKIFAFRNSDGGMAFSMKKNPSDIWTTAIALEVFSSVEPEWDNRLHIDVELLNRMVLWLTDQQDKITGAFQVTAHYYDLKTRPRAFAEDSTPLNISLTAHAAIALQKCHELLTGNAHSLAAVAIELAGDYLFKHFHQLEDPFQICQTTYALHVISHKHRAEAFRLMHSIRREHPLIYWSEFEIPSIPTRIVSTIPVLDYRQVVYPISTAAIQGTAYALMVYVRNNRFAEAEAIMQWLNTMRDSDNAFASTIDTLVATEALMKYAERNTNRGFQDMLVHISCTSTKGWNRTVHLMKHNFSNYETHSIPIVHGYVRASATGTGMALLQLTTTVNVEYPFQMRDPHVNGFNIDLEKLHFFGRNASNFHMNVCVSWRSTNVNPRSGAVIVEVDIPTGFHIRKQRLNVFARVGRIDSQRSRFAKQKVILHIDYLDREGCCYFFPGERWYPVANGSIQHQIRVYDIYNPGFDNTTLYTTYELFNNHICQVCGSFQCPYCPFYNTATKLVIVHETVFVILLLPFYLLMDLASEVT